MMLIGGRPPLTQVQKQQLANAANNAHTGLSNAVNLGDAQAQMGLANQFLFKSAEQQ